MPTFAGVQGRPAAFAGQTVIVAEPIGVITPFTLLSAVCAGTNEPCPKADCAVSAERSATTPTRIFFMMSDPGLVREHRRNREVRRFIRREGEQAAVGRGESGGI